MGVVVLDGQQNGGWRQAIGDTLGYWMAERQEEDERKRQEEERLRQQQELYDQNIARQFLGLDEGRQRQVYPQLPEGARRFVLNPAMIPERPRTAEEQAADLLARKRLAVLQGYDPDKFEGRYGAMEMVTGRTPNADFTKLIGAESYMDPNAFDTYANEGFTAPSDVAKNKAAAAKDKADAAFTAGPKTSTEYAQVGKYKAETGKIAEETITERELRDPNSPATRARATTAGRKSSAQTAIENINTTLSQLSAQETKLLTEIAGERAAAQAAGNAPKTPYLAKLESQLQQTRAMIQENVNRRNRVATGATKAGVPVQQPVEQQQLTAFHPETKQRIVSRDGGKTWVDAVTGQPVRVE